MRRQASDPAHHVNAAHAAVAAHDVLDALWLDMLQRVSSRAAHELKGALNGVSVNLEVVRSRAENAKAAASTVSRYAHVASEQLGLVIALSEALLRLGRAPREPYDAAAEVRDLFTLLEPAARAAGGALEMTGSMDAAETTAAPAAARIALAAAMLAGSEGRARVQLSAEGTSWTMRVERVDGEAARIDEEVIAAVAEAGVRLECQTTVICVTLPVHATAAAGD